MLTDKANHQQSPKISFGGRFLEAFVRAGWIRYSLNTRVIVHGLTPWYALGGGATPSASIV